MSDPVQSGAAGAQFVRVAARSGRPVTISLDGVPVAAIEGDSVLVALLTTGAMVRRLEFDGQARAGFCLMGACQDCWVWSEAAVGRLRACTTPVADGMRLFTRAPGLDELRG